MRQINETFQLSDRIFRILEIRDSELIWIDIQDPTAMPIFIHFLKIEKFAYNGSLVSVADPFEALALESPEPNSRADNIRNHAFKVIQSLIEDPDLFDRKLRSKKIQEILVEKKVSLATIYKYLRRYWQRGQTPNALIPDYKNCGC